MVWTAYQIVAIDFGWELLPTVEEVAGQLAKSAMEYVIEYDLNKETNPMGEFLANFRKARELAKGVGWEGDYRSDSKPRVFWLPVEGTFAYAFVWKHDNNGDTFVVSPHPLPWLLEL